jgi:hypothetical protein
MIKKPTSNVSVKTVAAREAATKRMRRCRARRRAGFRCLTIELHDNEIDALVHRGLLRVDDREIPDAIVTALYDYLEGSIGRPL